MKLVRFYYRQGCHLCEDMWQLLQEFRKEHPFELMEIDIDQKPNLAEKYGPLIPVLESEPGSRICHYYLDPVALEEYLQSSTRRT